jgi:hypothetical protein
MQAKKVKLAAFIAQLGGYKVFEIRYERSNIGYKCVNELY